MPYNTTHYLTIDDGGPTLDQVAAQLAANDLTSEDTTSKASFWQTVLQGEPASWYSSEGDMKAISQHWPGVLFTINGTGDDGPSDQWIGRYRDGLAQIDKRPEAWEPPALTLPPPRPPDEGNIAIPFRAQLLPKHDSQPPWIRDLHQITPVGQGVTLTLQATLTPDQFQRLTGREATKDDLSRNVTYWDHQTLFTFTHACGIATNLADAWNTATGERWAPRPAEQLNLLAAHRLMSACAALIYADWDIDPANIDEAYIAEHGPHWETFMQCLPGS